MALPAAELYFSEEELALQANQPSTPTFVQQAPEPALEDKIKIIGIGNAGRNALNHMIANKAEHVSFLAVDTDVRSLEKSSSPNKIILGKRGIGAGCVPDNGEQAARESLGEIMEFMRGADMIYITAGMGGGTGTGAIPVIANAAHNLGILTVAVVTKPFAFEGGRKMLLAKEGIEKLRPDVDALIVIPNERLLENCDINTSIPDAFAMADEVLRQGVLGVTELITKPGMVNMDFADVKAVMEKSGIAVMGTGRARGENRVAEALRQAMESPLMETRPNSAKGLLMNITSSGTLTLFELQQAAASVQECIREDTTFVWGTAEDPELEDEVKITIIATGLIEDSKNAVRITRPQYVDVTPQAATPPQTGQSFVPPWLRNEQLPQEDTTQPQQVEEAKPEIQPESLFTGDQKSDLDDPAIIRRKATAPKLG